MAHFSSQTGENCTLVVHIDSLVCWKLLWHLIVALCLLCYMNKSAPYYHSEVIPLPVFVSRVYFQVLFNLLVTLEESSHQLKLPTVGWPWSRIGNSRFNTGQHFVFMA